MKVTTNQDRLNELFDSDPRSLTSIAKELGVSKQAISMWKSGERSPKKSALIKIAEMYGVSIEWLMGFDVPRTPTEQMVIPIVVPNNERFVELVKYMPHDEYMMVMEAFSKAEKRLKEKEEKEKANDSLQTETGF